MNRRYRRPDISVVNGEMEMFWRHQQMVHKLALLIGGVAAVGVIAVAVAAGGLFPAAPAAAVDQVPTADTAHSTGGGGGHLPPADSQPGPVQTIVDKVYIAPTPAPHVIRVPAPPKVQRPVQSSTANNPPPRAERDDSSDSQSEHEPADHEHEHGDD